EIINLTWYPWVGKDFKNTIILGESHYDKWDDVDPVTSAAWLASKVFTRNRTAGPALNGNPKEPYFRNFERAYFGASQIERNLANNLWHSVAHFNLVQKVMKDKNERPTREDYRTGWDVFWDVNKILNTENVIVFGTDLMKIQTFRQLLLKHKIKADVIPSDESLGSRTK
ncbi:MAG: hypothetical protein L6407_00985, partial [Candidatus Delongbacteria bacterium]|nr:hypothetical protein [Candidatus Delongbacteria bacterium]